MLHKFLDAASYSVSARLPSHKINQQVSKYILYYAETYQVESSPEYIYSPILKAGVSVSITGW